MRLLALSTVALAAGLPVSGAAVARPADVPRVETATTACAVTRTSTGRLSARRSGRRLTTTLPPGGVLSRPRADDGSIGTKLGWTPFGFGSERELTIAGKRLDAPAPPLRVLGVNWGYSSTGRGSWATAVAFPSEGCWRITATVAGVRLSYVTRVVAR